MAILLIIALASGGSSGGSEEKDEERFDEFYAGRFQEDFDVRDEIQTLHTVTSATEQRFDRDREE